MRLIEGGFYLLINHFYYYFSILHTLVTILGPQTNLQYNGRTCCNTHLVFELASPNKSYSSAVLCDIVVSSKAFDRGEERPGLTWQGSQRWHA